MIVHFNIHKMKGIQIAKNGGTGENQGDNINKLLQQVYNSKETLRRKDNGIANSKQPVK